MVTVARPIPGKQFSTHSVNFKGKFKGSFKGPPLRGGRPYWSRQELTPAQRWK